MAKLTQEKGYQITLWAQHPHTSSNSFFKLQLLKYFGLLIQVSCGGCHMLVCAHPRLQNGDVSESSEEEDENDNLNKTDLNHSIKVNGSVDLGGSFGARNRRRQESIKRVSLSVLPPSQVSPPITTALKSYWIIKILIDFWFLWKAHRIEAISSMVLCSCSLVKKKANVNTVKPV